MRLLVAGGGTGGHLFPGVAVVEELERRGARHEVLFVGTARGIEARVLPAAGYAVEFIDVGGLKGRGPLGVLGGLGRVPRALMQSLRILRRFRPDLVLGVGGYASGPVVLMAALTGSPTAILEQNSVPGFTNRVLGHLVRVVFAAFEGSRAFFPARKVRLLGNPIRAAFLAAAQEEDAAMQQVAPATRPSSSRTLLVCGGSQGAHAVNELMVAAAELLAKEGRLAGWTLVHQSGAADQDALAARYRQAGVPVEVRAFIDDMAAAYRAADLVVARAGATTLAELTVVGRAALLIPLPTAADDHQSLNAAALAQAGAARVLAQPGLTARALADAIAALLDDEAARRRMAAAALAAGRPDAARAIVDALLALAV